MADLRLRQLQPGDVFYLKRTGEKYLFIRREHETPGGTRYVVNRCGFARNTTLHPSCMVVPCRKPKEPQ